MIAQSKIRNYNTSVQTLDACALNLNQFFSTKESKSINITVDDQILTLTKRPHSQYWQCRFKLPNGQWHQITTGQVEITEAKQQAAVVYHAVMAKLAVGLSAVEKNFGQLAIEEIANMERVNHAGSGKRTYRDYIFAIKKYLIPFFGRYDIKEITQEIIADFESWRISEMSKEPRASTKRNHASAFNRVINHARESGQIFPHTIVPSLDARGRASQARPAFTRQEIDQLLAFMESWEQGGRMRQEKLMRRLCRVYVEFLLYTGIRHGTEALPLRWRHLQWHWIGDKRYLRIWVSGKTGPRYLIAKHTAIDTLERIIKWHGLTYDNLDAVIKNNLDKRIFCFPDGNHPYQMEGVFRNLMRDSGLKKDSSGLNRTLYSLRHTYATFALADGIDIHTLARQMGTSVGMIERHYSKLTPMLSAEKLA